MGALADIQGTAVKLRYLACMAELDNDEVAATENLLVGAGIGGGFSNTTELKVMKYKEAMSSEDAEAWKEEVTKEKERFDKFNGLTPVPRSQMPKGTKLMRATWAMKKKLSGKLRGRLNAQ